MRTMTRPSRHGRLGAALPSSVSPAIRSGDRARSIPGGRAVLGTLLIGAAAIGAYLSVHAPTGSTATPVVVAAHDLGAGEALGPDDVRVERLHLPDSVRQRVIGDPAALQDVTLLGPLAEGELLQVGGLVHKAGGADSIEFSVPVDEALAAGGRIRDADRVTVLATTGTGEQTETAELVRDALVAHVDRPDRAVADAHGTLVVTLALDRDVDAVVLAHAAATGKIALVRTTGAPGHVPVTEPTVDSTATPPAPTTPTLPATTVAVRAR